MNEFNESLKAVVFDLDDTLYPEVAYVQSGFRAVAKHLARPSFTAQSLYDRMWDLFHNGSRRRIFNDILIHLGEGDEPQIVAELVGIYRCHRPALKLDLNIAHLLEQCRVKYKLGLITDGYLPAQRLKVEALQIDHFFDHIIFTEELGREYWKPSPRAFNLMIQNLAVPAEACLYIGDNPAKDFLAPNQTGWKTIQYRHRLAIHVDLTAPENGKPQMVCHNTSELMRLLVPHSDISI